MPKQRDNLKWLSQFTQEPAADTASSIIPTTQELPAAPAREHRPTLRFVHPSMLQDNPFQHRLDYKNIDALAEKMRQFGFTGSLRARPNPTQPGQFQVAYGHRRKRAAEMADVQVPIEVVDLTDEQMILLAVSENFEREDLNPLEEGNFFLQMNDDFGMSQEAIATFVGEGRKTSISRGYVNNRIIAARLAKQHLIVRTFLEEKPDVSLRAIGYLVSLNEEQISFVLKGLKQHNWTADHVASVAEALKAGGTEAEALMGISAAYLSPAAEAPTDKPLSGHTGLQAIRDNRANGKEPGYPSDEGGNAPQSKGVALAPDQHGNPAQQHAGQVNAVLNIHKRKGMLSDLLRRANRYAEVRGKEELSSDEIKMLEDLVRFGEQQLQNGSES